MSKVKSTNKMACFSWLAKETTKQALPGILHEASVLLTVDEKAFGDGLQVRTFFTEKDIAQATNFADLKGLWLLGNKLLPLLRKEASTHSDSDNDREGRSYWG